MTADQDRRTDRRLAGYRGDVVPAEAHAVRDLTVWREGGTVFVVACDSNASVGTMPHDFLQRPPEEAGYNATKVALMEVLACGATPFLVVNTLCGPLDGYGARVLAGLRRALEEIGSHALVTGSDETNMTTTQTGIGVTVLGSAPVADLRLGTTAAGDLAVCIGVPRDGVRLPYAEGDVDVAAPRDVLDVLAAGVHEVLPVGSKGVRYELTQLAATAGLALDPVDGDPVDLDGSAGASTCVLASVPAERLGELVAATTLPVAVLGTFHDPSGRLDMRRPVHPQP